MRISARNRLAETFKSTAKFAALLAVLSVSSVSQAKDGKKASAHLADVFPAPQCDVNFASHGLEYGLSQIGVPTWDGELPWPLMVGYWQNAIRDLYVTVSVQEIPQSQYGRVVVTFRSICGFQDKNSDNYLAYGAKIVTADDFKKSELSLPLRNFGLNGQSLVAVLEIVKVDETAQTCLSNSRLRITLKEKNRTGLVQRDQFVSDRMLSNLQ